MEGAGQRRNRMIPVCVCTHCSGRGAELALLSENPRAAGAYSRARHGWAAPDTERKAALS